MSACFVCGKLWCLFCFCQNLVPVFWVCISAAELGGRIIMHDLLVQDQGDNSSQ